MVGAQRVVAGAWRGVCFSARLVGDGGTLIDVVRVQESRTSHQ